MPALLGPTNPVPGYEPQPVKIQTPPPTDTNVQNIVNPEVVVRPDSRTDQQDTGDSTGATRYESNYMTFLQRLRTARNLPETFMRLLQMTGREITSGIRDGFAHELSEFLEFLRMDESALLEFLKNQLQTGSRFSGALFQILRDAYGGARSELIRSEILNFLRRYSDFSSTEHLESKILRETEDIRDSIPSPWNDQAGDILSKLKNGVAAGDREGNLRLLRGQLFPLIARYVSTTHDHGRARSVLSMLTLDVARYDNGSIDGLLRAFRHLASERVLPGELGRLSDEEILRLLRDAEYAGASRNNLFADRLAQLTNHALQGQGGAAAQEAFHNILASLLINESVYMPLSHAMIPVDWNGNKMFSEIWVDPDAENNTNHDASSQRVMRILIKLDIESLGAFDLLFNLRGENTISINAACPKSVTPFSDQISQALTVIFTRNGFQTESVSVAEMKRPLTISEAFPKIYKNMSGVNIKI